MCLSGRHFPHLLQATPDSADQTPGKHYHAYYAKGNLLIYPSLVVKIFENKHTQKLVFVRLGFLVS